MSKFFHGNIQALALENNNFRKEIATGNKSQIVVMSLVPNTDIGQEVHKDADQTLIFVSGKGQAVVAGQKLEVGAGDVVLVPSGTQHNFINTGTEPLKLYTIYAPAQHKPGTVHATKEDAENEEKY